MKLENQNANIHPNRNHKGRLKGLAGPYTAWIKAIIKLLAWSLIGSAFLAAAYVGIRGILVAVKIILNALGI